MARSARDRWSREGADWPNRDLSTFVRAGDLEWHVQRSGPGDDDAPRPALLLLHGAGAASHSWRGLLPLLATKFDVIAPDLPGHGFTGTAPGAGLSLPGIARRVASLLAELDAAPVLAVGHSAGAAVLARMALDGEIASRALVAINGALSPFRGLAGQLFPTMARLMHLNPFAARLVSTAAIDPSAVPLLIRSTGSRIDREGIALYARLFRTRAHVAGTLAMMAHWDLEPLRADLPRLTVPMTLLAGDLDRAVRPEEAAEIAALVPHAQVVALSGLPFA
jgi:magnesium chelatase accessory protein